MDLLQTSWFEESRGLYRADAWGRILPDVRTAKFNQMTFDAMAEIGPVHSQSVERVRADRSTWAGAFQSPCATWITVEYQGLTMRFRCLESSQSRATCLHLHSGGWVLGGADQQDAWLSVLHEAGFRVLSLDYPLAPEAVFPGALKQTCHAIQWMLDSKGLAADLGPIVICGESAGANMAIGAVNRLRQHPSYSRIRGLGLHYGTYDLRRTGSLWKSGDDQPFLNGALADWFCLHYGVDDIRDHPEVSPLLADLGGLPPSHLLVGSADPAGYDSVLLETGIREAGGHALCTVVAGGLHGMLEQRTPVTALAREVAASALHHLAFSEQRTLPT